MRTRKKTNFEPVTVSPPDHRKAIWCPYCDWHMKDQSHTARKRLGQHVADIHHDKVAFPLGEEPEDLD